MLDIRQTTAQQTETTVVCRLAGEAKGFFGTAVVLAVLLPLSLTAGLLLFPGFLWSNTALLLFTGAVCLVPLGIISAVLLVRSCIIADKHGLRWRKSGRWRSALWEDVTAQFETRSSSGSSVGKTSVTIAAPSGSLVLSQGYWSSEAEIWEAITRYAGQVSGLSPCGAIVVKSSLLPLDCRYNTAFNRNILGWLDDLHKYGLLAVVVYFALQWRTTHTLPGWGWLLTPTGLFVICKQVLPLVLRPLYRATQPRLGDSIVADEEGLRFITAQGETAVCWEDITDFYIAGIRYVIVTANGEYDFLTTLTNAEWLRMVIPRRAVNAHQSLWRLTGGRSGTRQRREVALANGNQSVQCRYHYRSPANCGQLWGLTVVVLFLAGITLGPALTSWQSGYRPSTQELAVAAVGVAGISALLWLWGNYWRGAIRTNEDGITQQTLLGRRFLPWDQIRAFRWQGGMDLTWGYVEGGSGTLTFWKGLGDADRLVDEIAAHGVEVR